MRAGVRADGRAPLAGTSHSCGPGALTAQLARIVLAVHHRTGMQPNLTPGTGSFLMTPPELLMSSRPFRTLPAQFMRGRGAGFFLAQCRMLVQNLDDMLMYPLPRALHFLYPVLRLPFWLLRVSRRRKALRAQGAGA